MMTNSNKKKKRTIFNRSLKIMIGCPAMLFSFSQESREQESLLYFPLLSNDV
jgi:hypothetical protein